MNRFYTRTILGYTRAMGMADVASKYDQGSQESRPISEQDRVTILAALDNLSELCISSDLESGLDQIARIAAALKSRQPTVREVFRSLAELHNRIDDELNRRVFLVLNAWGAQLYEDNFPFGEQVELAFPKCAFDISEAAKCLACDRSTASVFHCMRILEVGLHFVASRLRVEIGDDRNWQNILNDIDKAVGSLPNKTSIQKKKKSYLSGAASYLQHVKFAWRNPVMHVRGKYTPQEAANIWNAVRGFMQYLAGPVRVKQKPGGALGRIRSS